MQYQPMNALRKSLVVGGMTLALVGAGASAAWADTPNPAPVRQPGQISQPAQFQRPQAPVSVTGQVVEVNARSLTVRETNGRTTVFQVTPGTQISKGGRREGLVQLARRDRVQVTAIRTGNTLTATRIVDNSR
jgi:Domain of unknown function (DUF5666)